MPVTPAFPDVAATYDLTIAGVPCNELRKDTCHEAFDFTPGSQQFSVPRVLICDWGNRGTLINGLNSATHPDYPFMYALQFDVVPGGRASAERTFKSAIVTVGYKNLSYSAADLKEIQTETSSENVSKQGESMQFSSGSTPADMKVDRDVNTFITTTNYNVILHNQTSINEASWAALANKVNTSAFSVGTGYRSWPAESLLYVGYAIMEKISTAGKSFEVTHKFVGVEGKTHNQEWNPKTGDWDNVTAKTSNKAKYDKASFTGLV